MMGVGNTLHYPVNVSGYEAADYLCTEMCSMCFQQSGRTVVVSTTDTSPLSSFLQDHNRSRQANFFIHCTGIITSAYGSAQLVMVISYSSNSEPCTSHPVCANIGLLGVMPAGHSPTLPA